nr:glycine-rich RNA-binding protein 5, mitochondrial [Drosophila suzukii]
MRSAILFGLIVCMAFSLILALEETEKQSNDLSAVENNIGRAVESEVRAKRQLGFGGFGGPFGGFGGPIGGFGGPIGGFGGPYGGFGDQLVDLVLTEAMVATAIRLRWLRRIWSLRRIWTSLWLNL